jgi:hypothetical protein
MDRAAFQSAMSDPDAFCGVNAVAPGALRGEVPDAGGSQYLHSPDGSLPAPTLGQWGKNGATA